MTDETPTIRGQLEALATRDPRLDTEYVRLIATDPHPIILVGVVHDHPASVHRARTVVDELDPGVLALEVPDAVAPLFEEYAASADADGGEMSAAVGAAATDDVVGVDVPGRGALAALRAELESERPTLRTAYRTAGALGKLAAHTVGGWLRSIGVPEEWFGREFERTQEYDCPADATPDEQASHEAAHLRRSTSLMRSFERPPATRILDATRERYMARRLAALGDGAPVVAVLGFSHLDGVEKTVRGTAE